MANFLDALLFRDGILIGVVHWLILALLLFLLLVLVSIMKDVCESIYVNFNTAEILEENVFVTVVKKEYDASYTTFTKAGKVTVPIYHDDSYDVYLKYGDKKFVIDDEELYKRVNENDEIPAKLIKYLSKDGKVIDTDIEIE